MSGVGMGNQSLSPAAVPRAPPPPVPSNLSGESAPQGEAEHEENWVQGQGLSELFTRIFQTRSKKINCFFPQRIVCSCMCRYWHQGACTFTAHEPLTRGRCEFCCRRIFRSGFQCRGRIDPRETDSNYLRCVHERAWRHWK